MGKYYENLKINVDEIYATICDLDEEYELKSESKATPKAYFTGEALEKTTELDHKMRMLPYADKERLANKIDNNIIATNAKGVTSIMYAFYDGIHYYVPAPIESFKTKNYRR